MSNEEGVYYIVALERYTDGEVTVEAVQFFGTPESAVWIFEDRDIEISGAKFLPNLYDLRVGEILIPTKHGVQKATYRDYIIKNANGDWSVLDESSFNAVFGFEKE